MKFLNNTAILIAIMLHTQTYVLSMQNHYNPWTTNEIEAVYGKYSSASSSAKYFSWNAQGFNEYRLYNKSSNILEDLLYNLPISETEKKIITKNMFNFALISESDSIDLEDTIRFGIKEFKTNTKQKNLLLKKMLKNLENCTKSK